MEDEFQGSGNAEDKFTSRPHCYNLVRLIGLIPLQQKDMKDPMLN